MEFLLFFESTLKKQYVNGKGHGFQLLQYPPNPRRKRNAHILGVVGTSKPLSSDAHYIAFDGRHENDSHYLLAAALQKGDKITTIGSQIVKANFVHIFCHTNISQQCGLDYLFSSRIIIEEDIKSTNFEMFSDSYGHTVVAFVPDILPRIRDFSVGGARSLKKQITQYTVMSFTGEKLERHDDDLQSNRDRERVNLDGTSPQNRWQLNAGTSTNDIEKDDMNSFSPDSVTLCRREIIWRSLNSDLSLSETTKTYRDLLRISSLRNEHQHSIAFPRRSGKRRSATLHKCKGYIREEVTLTPDAFHNSVFVFERPSLNEICVLCGEVVQGQESPDSMSPISPVHSPNFPRNSWPTSEDFLPQPLSVGEGDGRPTVGDGAHQEDTLRNQRNAKGRFECPRPDCGKSYTARHNLQGPLELSPASSDYEEKIWYPPEKMRLTAISISMWNLHEIAGIWYNCGGSVF
ncbi:hypothetical protein BDP27DRAFT_1405269 [Rhodocollybia butyracea]|uniref:Uncharacterized protein n=1 Tax=Rhodocollybia butyracea TaxID=206335 RepID=A0A9P5U3K4_9AGAR|nr:hypothetical protein BDP27DRAFT_1405269 [Rhodocollybia butyracea]